MRDEPFVPALGALSGGQAVQSVKAGLKAIYCSGWQVAADANTAGQVYPDQSLYPADAVPTLVKRLNRALTRADQIEHAEGGELVFSFLLFRVFLSRRGCFERSLAPKNVSKLNQNSTKKTGATRDWYAPIVADAEAGFGGPLNCFEMMKNMIEAGAYFSILCSFFPFFFASARGRGRRRNGKLTLFLFPLCFLPLSLSLPP